VGARDLPHAREEEASMSEAVQPQDTHGAPFSARCGSTEIRPIRREDAGALFPQIHGQPGVIRWLSWEGPARVEELEARYATWRAGPADGPAYMFAVVDSRSGAVIGEASLRFDDHPGLLARGGPSRLRPRPGHRRAADPRGLRAAGGVRPDREGQGGQRGLHRRAHGRRVRPRPRSPGPRGPRGSSDRLDLLHDPEGGWAPVRAPRRGVLHAQLRVSQVPAAPAPVLHCGDAGARLLYLWRPAGSRVRPRRRPLR